MLPWMGFLGQELPGPIICDECTCSHMPVYNRSRTYRRPHVYAHPLLGTRSLPLNALVPKAPLLGASGRGHGHKISMCPPAWCQPQVLHVQDAAALRPALPAGPGGRTPPQVPFGGVSWRLARFPSTGMSQGRGCELGSAALSAPPSRWEPVLVISPRSVSQGLARSQIKRCLDTLELQSLCSSRPQIPLFYFIFFFKMLL